MVWCQYWIHGGSYKINQFDLSNVVLRITFIAIYNLILTEPAESSCIRDCLPSLPIFLSQIAKKCLILLFFFFLYLAIHWKLYKFNRKCLKISLISTKKIILSSLSCFFAEIEQTKRHKNLKKKCLNFTHVKKSHFELNQICL